MSHISVVELFILALTGSISVQLIKAHELSILHSGCHEYEDASQPTHLPYPDDCTKFYKCSGGYAFPMTCPNGLHWSVKDNRCEFPANAGCAMRDDNGFSQTTTKSSSVNDNDGIIVINCPVGEDPNEPTHLPYPGDCSKFFKCRIGKAFPFACPLGLHWSVALNRCEWPDIAKCDKINSVEPTPEPSPEPTSKAIPSLPPELNLSTQELNYICKNISSDILAYPGNCMRYIRCINGVGRTQFCPENLFFNSRLGVCSRTCAYETADTTR